MSDPTTHVATLDQLAKHYEDAARHFDRSGASDNRIAVLYRARAAAIRWILSETAHGVEPGELAV